MSEGVPQATGGRRSGSMSGSALAVRPRAGLWCRTCGLPARVEGDPDNGRAVHDGTGRETGPDGHRTAPITFETAVMRAAREIAHDYEGLADVALAYGGTVILAEVTGTLQHTDGVTADELRAKLDILLTPSQREQARKRRGAEADG